MQGDPHWCCLPHRLHVLWEEGQRGERRDGDDVLKKLSAPPTKRFGASLPEAIWMGLPIKRTGFLYRVLTKSILPTKPWGCCCTKPQTKSLSHCLQNFSLLKSGLHSLTPSASQSFHLFAVFQISFSPKCANLKLSQWIWFEFYKSQRRKKMLLYLTSAVTHLNFFNIMWSNHRQRCSCWFFQRYIFTSLDASKYCVKLLMPESLIFCASLCRTRQLCTLWRHFYFARMLVYFNPIMPVFLCKLKINNFWKSCAQNQLLKESRQFANFFDRCQKNA